MTFLSSKSGKSGQLCFEAEGAWTAENADQIEILIEAASKEALVQKSVQINLNQITSFDTYGAWLIERFKRNIIENGAIPKVEGLAARNAPLLNEATKAYEAVTKTDEQTVNSESLIESAEKTVTSTFKSLSSFPVMVGAMFASMGRMFRSPKNFRLTSTIYQLDRVGWQALPIVLMVTFIIGAIIAQQGFFHFRRFGAELYVVDMIGFLVMREIGVLLVAIVIAGRSGSSYTAELGSMKMREEIDALKTMGFNPVDVLLLPRVLVLVVVLPILTFIGSLAALLGAGLVATTYAGLTAELFMDRLNDAITLDHFLVGLIKAPFIGFVIGVIACAEGLQVKGSTNSLGHHTTQSVVKSIFMVIVLDGLFALFFSAIRM
jgi:phospholipid/cholesterol/gamma-HCH transport system permease protein